MADVVKEKDIWVHSFRMPPDSNNSIKMEVGIEDCLHIEFEYNKSKWVEHGSVFQCGYSHRTRPQISLEGRHCGKDLLFARSYQDQAYGAVDHSEGDYRSG